MPSPLGVCVSSCISTLDLKIIDGISLKFRTSILGSIIWDVRHAKNPAAFLPSLKDVRWRNLYSLLLCGSSLFYYILVQSQFQWQPRVSKKSLSQSVASFQHIIDKGCINLKMKERRIFFFPRSSSSFLWRKHVLCTHVLPPSARFEKKRKKHRTGRRSKKAGFLTQGQTSGSSPWERAIAKGGRIWIVNVWIDV